MRKKKWLVLLCVLFAAALLCGTNAFHARTLARETAHAVCRAVLRAEYRLTGRDTPLYVPVLMYHSVSESPVGCAELSVRPADFQAQMDYLAKNGFTPITFDQLADAEHFSKPVLITFDDGYADNFTEAYPVLQQHGFHATVFMITGFIGSPGFLSGGDIRQMLPLVSFQSHTVRHYRLSTLSENDAALELRQSQASLAAMTGQTVTALSYPEGDYDSAVLKLVPKYYAYAVTTKFGYWRSGTDRYRICRLAVGRSMRLERFKKLMNVN